MCHVDALYIQGMFVMNKLLIHSFIITLVVTMLSACGSGGDSPPESLPPESLPSEPLPSDIPQSSYSLFMQQGLVTITNSPDTNFGATTLSVWGFASSENPLAGTKVIPGTTINAEIGNSFTVSVKNNLSATHNFNIAKLPADEIQPAMGMPIAMGETVTYTITPTTPGIYLYDDSLNNGVNRSLGLFGVMIVRPEPIHGNVVWEGGPGYDKEVTWVITDMDYPNWNQIALSNGADQVDTTRYKANYFLMNGMNGFQAMQDDQTTIHGQVGETILVRIANAGQYSQSLHFHGNHFQVISRNGIQLSDFENQDTINVKPNETAMVLYTIDQTGHYPMHVHTAQLETGGGVYLNGTAAMIIGE